MKVMEIVKSSDRIVTNQERTDISAAAMLKDDAHGSGKCSFNLIGTRIQEIIT